MDPRHQHAPTSNTASRFRTSADLRDHGSTPGRRHPGIEPDLLSAEHVAALGHPFAILARGLTLKDGSPVDPEHLVRLVARAVSPAIGCGLTLLRGGRPPHSVANTGGVCIDIDHLQHRLHEGPCIDTAAGDAVTVCPDTANDPRWPRFGALSARLGVRSVLSVRLSLGGEDHAAINIYGGQVDVFTPDDVATASLLAPFASVSVQAAVRERDVEDLQTALTSSRRIGTAIGLIMARQDVTSDEALHLLKRVSQNTNRKLRDLAAEIEQTGRLPQRSPEDPFAE